MFVSLWWRLLQQWSWEQERSKTENVAGFNFFVSVLFFLLSTFPFYQDPIGSIRYLRGTDCAPISVAVIMDWNQVFVSEITKIKWIWHPYFRCQQNILAQFFWQRRRKIQVLTSQNQTGTLSDKWRGESITGGCQSEDKLQNIFD